MNQILDRTLAAGAGNPGANAPKSESRAAMFSIGRELAAVSEAQHAAGLNRLIMGEAYQFPELAPSSAPDQDAAAVGTSGPFAQAPCIARSFFLEAPSSSPIIAWPIEKRPSVIKVTTRPWYPRILVAIRVPRIPSTKAALMT